MSSVFLKHKSSSERSQYCNYTRNDNEFINKSDILLSLFVITSQSLFSIVEKDYFQKLFDHLNEHCVPPSRTTITEKIIPDMMVKIKETIPKEID